MEDPRLLQNIVILVILFIAITGIIIWPKMMNKSGLPSFGSTKPNPDFDGVTIPDGKNFQFAIYDDDADIENEVWYRIKDWKYPDTYLRRESSKNGNVGLVSPYEEKVMGLKYENRWRYFIMIADQPEFRLYLEREPDNKFDPNAIKVMGSAVINGKKVVHQFGYVQKDTAKKLKKIDPINIGSAAVSFQNENHPLILKIKIV